MSEKKKLSLQIDSSDYDTLVQRAGLQNVSVSEYVRRQLTDTMPPPPVVTPVQTKSSMDVAFEELDKQDAIDTGSRGILPVAPQQAALEPARHPMDRTDKRSRQPPPQSPPGPHPCQHLSTQRIPPQLRGQCLGTCQHSQQYGRACMWPPTAARDCSFFEAKLHTLQRAGNR